MSTSWGKLSYKLIEQAKQMRIPVSGHFELTPRCNLKCKMCYICRPFNDPEAAKKERTAEEWIRIAEEARDAGMLYLLLTGGEVFLRKDFKIIYEAISTMGLSIEIFTNATMLTPEIAKWLGRIPPSKVGVTLYGASGETYKKICGNYEAFQRALNGVDLLLKEGITVQLRTTIIRENIDDFEKIVELSESRGVGLGVVNYISPRREGCGTHPEDERLTPEELTKFERHIGECIKNNTQSQINVSKYEDYDSLNDLSNKTKDKAPSENYDHFYCAAGKSSFWVTWDGRMTPCGDMNTPFSNPLDVGFNYAWKELQKGLLEIPECSECRECTIKDYCLSCPARLKSETGFYDKPSPYLCEFARNRKKLKK